MLPCCGGAVFVVLSVTFVAGSRRIRTCNVNRTTQCAYRSRDLEAGIQRVVVIECRRHFSEVDGPLSSRNVNCIE